MGGIRSKPTSSLQVPEKKYRATSAPPDTCTPTCPRYPLPSADTSGSWNKLYALTLSWRHACGSLRGRAVCVKMHCTPLAGVDGVGNVRQPRYAVGQVLWSLMTPPWVYRDHCAGPGLPRFVEITIATKRGKPGPAQWSLYTQGGVINDHNTWPTAYRGWRTLPTPSTPANGVQCILTQTARPLSDPQACRQDSVSAYNLFQDPDVSALGRGYLGQVGV